jgi:hypothetical protein
MIKMVEIAEIPSKHLWKLFHFSESYSNYYGKEFSSLKAGIPIILL